MKYVIVFIILICSVTKNYAQEKAMNIYACSRNPTIIFGKQRMKLNMKEIKIIREFGKAVKHFSDSTKRETQITLCIFGDEKSTRGITRAKTISDLLVKYERIRRSNIFIFETPSEDCFDGNESIALGLEYYR
jgi:AraC-like DNA-binding protein